MSFSQDRNPSPPPEILDSDENLVPDRIGSSLYSKRWLYKTLMNMLKVVQEYSNEKENPGDNYSNQTIMELDLQTEEEACTLWDMSASQEIAEFLCECDVGNIFLEIIEHTKSPRLLEIVVGILGNMSSYNSTCDYITNNKPLVCALIMLSGCSDSCTLVQLFRLLICGIIKENCQQKWFNLFEENPFFMENLQCILQNNLCRDVLKGLLEFLDTVLNHDSKYCSMWGEQSYSLALIECGKQLLKCDHYEDLDIFFTVVNTLCQQSFIVPLYANNFDALRPIFHAYFSKLGEEEFLPQISRVTAVTSTFALYGNLLFSGNILQEHLLFDDLVFNSMLNMCKMVKKLLINMKSSKKHDSTESSCKNAVSSVTMTQERNGDSLDDEDILQNWGILVEAIIHAAKACASLMDQANDLQVLKDIISFQKIVEDTS